jgi:hypothetical protein
MGYEGGCYSPKQNLLCQGNDLHRLEYLEHRLEGKNGRAHLSEFHLFGGVKIERCFDKASFAADLNNHGGWFLHKQILRAQDCPQGE